MKTRTIGFALIIVGILALAYTGFNYVTSKRVVDIGSLKIDSKQTHHVQWPPILGVILIVGGVVTLISDGKKSVS